MSMPTEILNSTARVYKLNQFSVPTINQPGELGKLLLTLKHINLLALSADAGSSAQILVKFVTDAEPIRVKELLRAQNLKAFYTPVFAIKVSNASGALLKVIEWLAENGLNIRTIYGTTGSQEPHAWLILETDNTTETEQILFDKYS
jgi:hypothetical protein